MSDRSTVVPSRILVAAAFAAVYTIWGSTYLAIRVAVETLPPFLMAGVRFLIAGSLLYAIARWRGAPPPRRSHWRPALIIGGLLLLGGNGGVVWAEQVVPSGITALMVTAVPLWMVLLHWAGPGGVRPSGLEIVGLVLGLVGVAVLVDPVSLSGSEPVNPVGAVVLILASLSWAIGSLYSRRAKLPDSPLMATAIEMLAGGALLLVAGIGTGEAAKFNAEDVSLQSVLALAYLVVFGALVGFTAYIWLLGVSTPAKVSTYAYVNPVIAVLLGWAVLAEPLTGKTLLAMVVIVSGVVLITTRATRGVAQCSEAGACAPKCPDDGVRKQAPVPLLSESMKRSVKPNGYAPSESTAKRV